MPLCNLLLLSTHFYIVSISAKPKDISSLDFIRMKKVNDHFVYVEERELKKGKSQPKFVILLR